MLSEWMSDLTYRLRAVFRRAAVERELDDELRFHLERETEKLIRGGLSPAEAERRARVAFGGVERTKEESRDVRGVSLLDVAMQDIRYALRGLRQKPAFTAAVIVTLGLGIGANAAMFGIVDRLMFREPAFLRDPGRVHRVYLFSTSRGTESSSPSFEYTRYLDLARWTTVFSHVAAYAYRPLAIGAGEDARELMVGTVSASFFDFFDALPVLGRFFTRSEDTVPAGAPVVVLSHGYWQSRYGGRADALGAKLQIKNGVFTIIGVAPPGFVGLADEGPPAAFIPITSFAGLIGQGISDYYTSYSWGWMRMLVRRKPSVSLAAANADLSNAYARSYEAERSLSRGSLAPATLGRPHAVAAPVQPQRGPSANRAAQVVVWISGVSIIVLLIACANVTNLLLARAQRRRREIALRVALGVGRGRLFSQLLTESLLLAALGGVTGVVVAQLGSGVLRRIFLDKEPSLAVATDVRTLLFAAAAALGAGLVTGLAPALHAGRDDLATALKAGAREGGGSYRRSRVRTLLLVAQGALAVVLLVGAGLFLRSLRNVRALRIGYDVTPVLYVEPNLRGMKLEQAEHAALVRRLRASAASMPGVESAALAMTVPFWNTWSQGLYVPGVDSLGRLGSFTLQSGSPEYFQTLGTRIVRGRGLTVTDREGAPGAVVVSEAMARTLWPGKEAIGQCLHLITTDTLPCSRVVGIAENIKQSSLTEDSGLHYYLSLEQFHPGSPGLFVRTSGDATQYVETVRRRLQALMPGSAYVTVTRMEDIVAPNERAWSSGATMFAVFSGLALVLAAVGLYSVIAYDVAQRTHELGVRIALGAQPGDVLRLVVGAGVRFAVAGVAIGTALALVGGRWLTSLLYDVSPRDPLVFGVVTIALLGVAVVASALPAMRATRVDPNVALRAE